MPITYISPSSPTSLAHAYIYKVEKNQKSFEKMQKICKKPLTKGDVCDIISLPLPKGFFVVRNFACNLMVIVPPKWV